MSSKSSLKRPITPTRKENDLPVHWSSNVHECAVCIGADGTLHLPIAGGSDKGEFAYFAGLQQARISYVSSGRLEDGDVLLEVQRQKVAGFTQRDVVAWLNHCCKSGHPVTLYVAKGGFLGKDLRQHLNTRFPKNSADCELQNTVRDNLYLRTVPCTTRTPRDGELHGVDYTFLSVEDFMILERSGNLLESGLYEGNHYGTPKPLEECPVLRPSSSALPGIHPSSEGKRRRNRSSVEAMTAKITGEPESNGGHPGKNNISSSDDTVKPCRKDVSEEDEGPLPENWERAFTEDGEPYFIDHNTGTSQWLDPRPKNKKPVGECKEDELPYGWEKIDDPHYGTYYIDHVNKRTQYENPVAQARKISTSSLHEDSPKNSSEGGQWRSEKEQSRGGSLPRHLDARQRKDDRGGPPYAGLRGSGYRPPYVFTEHPEELEGAMVRTSLVKSTRGFGFTIVGGDDGDVREFLQVKAITLHGPAWQDGKLAVGDVLVHINDECVLGFSHQDVVSLFQSIPPGEMVHVGVCRGYGLPFDPEDPTNEIVLTNGVSSCGHGNGPSGLCGCLMEGTAESTRSAKSMPDLTAFQPQQLQRASRGCDNAASTQDVSRADLLSVEIVKGKGGFGFTIADSVYGQKVKKILDCERCQHLQEGDVLTEINGRNIRGLPHCEVVQLLKDCPCDQPAHIAIHRGLLPKVTKMKSADDLGVRRSASNNSSHSYSYRSPISDDTYTPAASSMYRSKTPTADLYSSKEQESVHISRPKTPLVDTRHWQKPASTSSEPSGNHQQHKINGNQLVNPEPLGNRLTDFSNSWRADHPPVQLRTAYSAALDKTTVNPSWYTTLGKLRDTYWAENHNKELNKSMDFGSVGHTSDVQNGPQYDYSQPKPNTKANFNDSYEDSVFLSNHSWSSKSVHENGMEWNSSGYPQGVPPNDMAYVRTNSIRSNGPYYSNGAADHDPAYRTNSMGHSPNSSSYDSLQRRKRGTSFEHENPPSMKGEGLYSGGGSVYSQPGSVVLRPSMLGREYMDMVVTLLRQESGFGFRIVGGTEEGSQVAIGHLVPGGAADLDGRIRTGDEIVSVDNQLVLNTSHHRVVQLIGSTAANGKVALGLRRRVSSVDSAYHTRSMESIYPYDVTITRQENEGFGFVIISSISRAGATIGRIIEGSPADRCGQLHVGDRILCVNGTSTLDLHHGETVNLIKESGHAITLSVGQPMEDNGTPTQQEDDQYHAIELRRGTKGFGFSIRGGREFQNMPLFVLRIAEGGPAHLDGKLVVGDQIIEINSKNTKNMTHAQAIELIRQGNDSVRLLVRRGFTPQEGINKLSLDSDPFDPMISISQGRLMGDAPATPLVNGGAATRYRKNSNNLKHSNILQNDNLTSQMPLGRFPQHPPPSVQIGGPTSDKSQDYYAWNYEQH